MRYAKNPKSCAIFCAMLVYSSFALNVRCQRGSLRAFRRVIQLIGVQFPSAPLLFSTD